MGCISPAPPSINAPVCGEVEVVCRKDEVGDGQGDQEEAGRMPAQFGTKAKDRYNGRRAEI